MKFSLHILILLSLLSSCKTNVDVFAPEKEIYAIVGILDPNKDEQFIKISSVFQFDGDILKYGSTEDFSVKGLLVTLEGNGKTITAVQRDDVAKEQGIFSPWQTLYVFETNDSDKIIPYKEYTLHIRKPGDETIDVHASTTIPGEPGIVDPRGPIQITSGLFINPSVSFHDGFSITFDRPKGYGFEVRVFVDYYEGTQMKTVRWGPTQLFQEPVNCYEPNRDRVCFYIQPDDVLRTIRSATQSAQDTIHFSDSPDYANDPDELNKNVRLEATSIDSFLTKYLVAGNPFGYGDNLLMDKREWTNISGGIGIFGSIHTFSTFLRIEECDEFLSGLDNYPIAPPGCEW